jgi:hypothetical protein
MWENKWREGHFGGAVKWLMVKSREFFKNSRFHAPISNSISCTQILARPETRPRRAHDQIIGPSTLIDFINQTNVDFPTLSTNNIF